MYYEQKSAGEGARAPAYSCAYMIAVGGAGSSGLPALASGSRTITNAMMTNTMNPEYVAGWAKITGSGLLKK
jgi:hypothetical protein